MKRWKKPLDDPTFQDVKPPGAFTAWGTGLVLFLCSIAIPFGDFHDDVLGSIGNGLA
jgi:hypothetical protein